MEQDRYNDTNQFIRKNDSVLLYGIAILLMVFHHCFCDPSRLMFDYIPVIGSFEIEARIAWVGRLCVPIYAFITGYAFSINSRSENEINVFKRVKTTIKFSIIHLLKFILKFWFVYLIVIFIGICISKISLDPYRIIKGMFSGGLEYCGEWWYVNQYINFIVLYPVLDLLLYYFCCNKVIVRVVIISLTISGTFLTCMLFWEKVGVRVTQIIYNQIHISYTLIFVVAFLIGYFKVFEKINERLKIKSVIYGLISFFVILFRLLYIQEASQHECDIYLTPILVFALVGLFHIKTIENNFFILLNILGKYSTYIWLIHAFFIYYYFQPIALFPRYSILIFVWVMFVSLVCGIIIDKVYKIIMSTFFNGYNRLKSVNNKE